MNAGLQTSNDYLELWHAYIDFLRRQINFNDESDKLQESIESLRSTIQLAINQLYEYFKHNGDPNLSLEKYWAQCEAKYFKNMENARKIWNEMIIQKNGFNMLAHEWIDFYHFECKFGDEKHQRKVLQRALNEPVLDDKYTICELYNQFEKLNGNIDSYFQAKVKIDTVLLKLKKDEEKLLAQQKQQKTSKKENNNDKKPNKQPQKHEKKQKATSSTDSSLKRKVNYSNSLKDS
jgi:hypothetical protein